MTQSKFAPLRVSIGGPIGAGKTTLIKSLSLMLRDKYSMAIITHDLYTEEDALFLRSHQTIDAKRIIAIKTENTSPEKIQQKQHKSILELINHFADLQLILIETQGDYLNPFFSIECADLNLYLIDVAAGDKTPRKGSKVITDADFLIINKTDLAPYVGASLRVMECEIKNLREDKPFLFTNLKNNQGLEKVIAFIVQSLDNKLIPSKIAPQKNAASFQFA